jgi:hypothetical protein
VFSSLIIVLCIKIMNSILYYSLSFGHPLNLVLYIPFRIFIYTEKKTFSLVVVFVVIKEEDFGLHHDT